MCVGHLIECEYELVMLVPTQVLVHVQCLVVVVDGLLVFALIEVRAAEVVV